VDFGQARERKPDDIECGRRIGGGKFPDRIENPSMAISGAL